MHPSVEEWLHGLGLGQFKPVFDAPAIVFETLAYLSDTHLREMGIPIGPRVTLLAAIAQLNAGAGLADAVERRRMTVMFADLVGSTQLSRQLDPEDLREVIRAFHGVINREVEPFDAYVAQY